MKDGLNSIVIINVCFLFRQVARQGVIIIAIHVAALGF